MIKGLIFDFDGLILDTEFPIYAAWQEIFQQHGCELPFEQWAETIGSTPGLFDPAGFLENILGKGINREELTRTQDLRSLALINAQMALPGVEQYLQAGKALGLCLAIASSSEDEWVYTHLQRIGLLNYFEHICTSDQVEKVKPDPELFNCVLAQMGLKAEETIVFEDLLNGIKAAKAAGCYAVAVPNQVTRLLDLSSADLVISSMETIPLQELIRKFA